MTEGTGRRDIPIGLPALPTASYNPAKIGGVRAVRHEDANGHPADTAEPIHSHGVGGQEGPSSEIDPLQRVSGFDFVRVVGRGGHGEVWEGTQARLGRAVAIKRLRPGMVASTRTRDSAEILRAFRHEALTAASLDHPNIVPVYDFGVNDAGEHILAMKLVRGTAWDELLRRDWEEMRAEDYLAFHLPILASVCQAVAFAHSKGLIHRDLKPSQVMIGEFGETLLMDWGLALRVGRDGTAHEPGVGEIPEVAKASNPAGTPAYMAPEQTSQDPAGLGLWTDIYLLGGILYQILTGRPPHLTNSAAASFERAASGVVTPPTWASSGRPVPAELEELAMASLSSSPAQRPESVREFLARLNAYLSGATRRQESEAISSRVAIALLERTLTDYAGFTEALSRLGESDALWPENPVVARLRRDIQIEFAETALANGDLTLARAVISAIDDRGIREGLQTRTEDAARVLERQRRNLRFATTASFVLLAGIIIAGAAFSWRLEHARQKEFDLRVRAQTAEMRAAGELNYSSGLLAGSLIDQGRIEQARAVLWQIPEEARDWEWGLNAARAYQSLREYSFQTLAASPDDSHVVSLGVAGREGAPLVLRDLESGRIVRSLESGPGNLLSCRFLDTGKEVASVWSSGVVLIEPVSGGGPARRAEFPGDGLRAVALSADGSVLAHANGGVEVRVIDVATGRELSRFDYECPARLRPTVMLDVSPDGRFVAASNGDAVAVWDLREGRIAWNAPEFPWDDVTALGLDATSTHLWFTVRMYSTGVVDLRQGSRGLVYLNEGAKSAATVLADKGLVIAAGLPGRTGILSSTTGDTKHVLFLPEPAQAAWASADGSLAATACGGVIDVWNVSNGVHQTRLLGHAEDVDFVHFLAGGSRLLTSSADGTTRIWDARSPTDLPRFHGEGPSLQREGRHHIAIGDSRVTVRSISTGLPVGVCGLNMAWYYSVLVTPDDAEIITLGVEHEDHVVDTYSVAEGRTVARVGFGKNVSRNFLAPDPDLVLSLADDRRVVSLRRRLTGELIRTIGPLGAPYASHDFTRDSSIVAVGDAAGEVCVEDVSTSSALWRARVGKGTPVLVRAAGATGRLLVLAPGEDVIRELETLSGRPTATYGSGGTPLASFFCDAGGTLVAGMGEGGASFIWDRVSGRLKSTFKASSSTSGRGSFLPEGRRLLLPSADGFQVFDTETGREVAAIFDSAFMQATPDGGHLLFGENRNSWILALAPWSSPLLAQYPGGTFEERFRNWRLARYRAWWVRDRGFWAEKLLPGAVMAEDVDVVERPDIVEGYLDGIVDGLPLMDPGHLELLERCISFRQSLRLRALMAPGSATEMDRGDFERLDRAFGIVRDPAIREFIDYMALRAAAGEATRALQIKSGAREGPGDSSLLEPARLLVRVGERDAAVSLLRLEVAWAWLAQHEAPGAEEALRRLGGSLPTRPPADAIALAGDEAAAVEVDAVADRERRRADYLLAVAKPPDFGRLIEARWNPRFLRDLPGLREEFVLLAREIRHEIASDIASGASSMRPAAEFDKLMAGSDGF